MITKHTDTYWTNSFHGRFTSEQAAIDDEELRTMRPLTLKSSEAGIADYQPNYTEIVGAKNGVWSGQPHWGVHRVQLLRDIVTYCNEWIALHGEWIACMKVNQGMGHERDRFVIVGPNPQYKPRPNDRV